MWTKTKGQYCEFCLKSGDNGAWIDNIIEQAKDPRHDQSAFKDKKKKMITAERLLTNGEYYQDL